MKRFLYPCALAIMAISPAFSAVSDCASRKNVPDAQLTLSEIIDLGLCRNPQTAAAFQAAEAARFNKNANYAPYLPYVDASASASKSYRNKDWSDVSYGATLSASYLIFDFGKRLSDLNASAATWRAAGFDYDTTVQNYIYDIVSAYYSLLATDAGVKAANDLVTVATTAKKTADTKFKAGAVAKADVLKADTTLASRNLDLERVINNREIAKGKLLYLLSFTQDQKLEIRDMPAKFGTSAENKNVEELIEGAKQKNPALLSATESVNAARNRRNSSILRMFPTISASGSISYNDDPAYTYINNDAHYNGQIGLRVSMPLFTGFQNIYNARAADANYERAEYLEQQKQDSTSLDVWTAFQNYKTAQKVLEQSDTLLKSATESEKSSAGMYRVGRSNMLDWQTAQAELADAQRQNISAKYDLFIKRAALALSVGELQQRMVESE